MSSTCDECSNPLIVNPTDTIPKSFEEQENLDFSYDPSEYYDRLESMGQHPEQIEERYEQERKAFYQNHDRDASWNFK